MSFREHGIVDVVEGLEVIRRRPEMYIGEAAAEQSMCSRLVEIVATSAANVRPRPTAVRVTLWADSVVTVALDGTPFELAPDDDQLTAISPYPELYRTFMYLPATTQERPLSYGGAVVNALSERLVVWTRHGDVTYRVAFRRAGLVSLLAKSPTDDILGTKWMTFKPDDQLVTGSLTFVDVERIAMRLGGEMPGVSVRAVDRTDDQASWV